MLLLLVLLTVASILARLFVHLRAADIAATTAARSHPFHILFTSSIFTYFISAEHSTPQHGMCGCQKRWKPRFGCCHYHSRWYLTTVPILYSSIDRPDRRVSICMYGLCCMCMILVLIHPKVLQKDGKWFFTFGNEKCVVCMMDLYIAHSIVTVQRSSMCKQCVVLDLMA